VTELARVTTSASRLPRYFSEQVAEVLYKDVVYHVKGERKAENQRQQHLACVRTPRWNLCSISAQPEQSALVSRVWS
jgi:hypothetical protein